MVEILNILNETQKSFASHPQIILKVRSHFSKPSDFLKEICIYLRKIFYLKTSKTPVKRILRFISHVGTYPATDDNTKIWVEEYCTKIIQFCLMFIKSEEKKVITRALEIIVVILNNLPDNFSINEKLFEMLLKTIYPLLNDTNFSIRIQAVIALARLQSPLEKDDRITLKFVKMIRHDPNQLVRETVLQRIGIVKHTLPVVLTRVRDISENVRKSVYIMMKEKLAIKSLSIMQRNSVLRSGIGDRCEIVKKECGDLLLNHWIPSCNSLINFLKLLDIEENETDSSIIMSFLMENLTEIDSKSMPPFIDNLNAEKAFLWHHLSKYLLNKKPFDWDKLDRIMLSVDEMSKLMEKYKNESFIFAQLISVCKCFDFKNEKIRSEIFEKIYIFLIDLEIPNTHVSSLISILRMAIKNELDLAKQLLKAISILFQKLDENGKNNKIGKDKKKENETLIYTKILEIIKEMLKYSQLGMKLPKIEFIKNNILECVVKDNPFIRAPALEALSLYCYFDANEARRYILLIYHVLKKDQEAIQIIALKSIFDLLLIHRNLSNLKTDPIYSNSNNTNQKNTIIDTLSNYLGSDDEVLMYTAIEGFTKLLTLRRIQNLKPLSMCILLLFNPNSGEDEPIQQCLSLFFSSFLFLNSKNYRGNARFFAEAFLPTAKIILKAPKTSPLSKIDILQFANWAISHLPFGGDFKDEKMKEAFERNKEEICSIRYSIIFSILNEILQHIDQENYVLNLTKIILKIDLKHKNMSNLIDLVKKCSEMAENNNCEKYLRFALRRLFTKLSKDSKNCDKN